MPLTCRSVIEIRIVCIVPAANDPAERKLPQVVLFVEVGHSFRPMPEATVLAGHAKGHSDDPFRNSKNASQRFHRQ